MVPDEYRQDAHHWLILHGRYTCKARKPDCPHCVIRDLCRFPDKTQESPPAKPSAAKPASRRSCALFATTHTLAKHGCSPTNKTAHHPPPHRGIAPLQERLPTTLFALGPSPKNH